MFKEIINFQKITRFIKYHNAFTIGLVLIFIFGASVFASDTIREATIGMAVIEKAGIDNTALLAADLDNFDFSMQINNVTEDEENYYVLYTYKTLDIKNDVWQPVSRQETMEVSKSALAGRDLGLYVAEELGEIVDSQKAYLVKVQQKQKQKGVTLVRETTIYTGLIGMVLNPKTRELPGYEPVVKQPEPVAVVYTEPSALLETVFLEVSCNPDWICSDWTPVESTVALGETFTQTRICTDQNNCDTEQAKPKQEYIAIGTYQSASTGGTECTPIYYYYDGDNDGYGYTQGSFQITCVQPEGHVSNNTDCDDGDPNVNPGTTEICDDQIDNNCDGIIDNPALCQTTTPTTTPTTTDTTTSTTTVETCDLDHLNLCQSETDCQIVEGYWYNEICNIEPETPVCTPIEEICDGLDNDCDGLIDEDLLQQCGSSDIGACQFGTQTCQTGVWSECQGAIEPVEEICDDSVDNNCDGQIDEGCTPLEPEPTTESTTTPET